MTDPSDPFADVSRLALARHETSYTSLRQSRRPPRHAAGEPFLKGPIPWAWLREAARLPGKALAVALMVWRLAGMHKSDSVAFSLTSLEGELGVTRDSARRGLEALEVAGLVSVHRHPGRKPVVTLLPARDGMTGSPTKAPTGEHT